MHSCGGLFVAYCKAALAEAGSLRGLENSLSALLLGRLPVPNQLEHSFPWEKQIWRLQAHLTASQSLPVYVPLSHMSATRLSQAHEEMRPVCFVLSGQKFEVVTMTIGRV